MLFRKSNEVSLTYQGLAAGEEEGVDTKILGLCYYAVKLLV